VFSEPLEVVDISYQEVFLPEPEPVLPIHYNYFLPPREEKKNKLHKLKRPVE
jgi:hypothetical protein